MGRRSYDLCPSRPFVKAVGAFTGIYLHQEPVDMRRGINGLCDVVAADQMGDLSGPHLFVFCGKRRGSIKVLYFDKNGFCLWQKRLERERFPWPKNLSENTVTLSPQQFSWLLEGFDVWKMKPFRETKFEKVY